MRRSELIKALQEAKIDGDPLIILSGGDMSDVVGSIAVHPWTSHYYDRKTNVTTRTTAPAIYLT